MNKSWNWAGRYVAVIVVSLLLAAALGSMELFEKTAVFSGKLTASHLVRFLGFFTALIAFWLLGQRATIVMRQQGGGRWSFTQHLILPVVSLVFVAVAYSIMLLLLKPFLDASLHNAFNWMFIVAILAAAAWLVMAVLNQSASLTEAFTFAAKDKVCPGCGASCGPDAKFCDQCGKALDVAAA